MKKTFILFIIMCLTVGTFGQNSSTDKGKAEWNDWSKWSITLEGGVNYFDGDIKQDYNALMVNSLAKLSLGVGLEYTISPAWSLGIDYMHLPLSAKYENNGLVIADFSSKMHNASFFTSFNPIKTFLPNTKTKWGIWANIGLGYAWYNSTYYTDRAGTGVVSGSKTKYTDFNDTINDGKTMFVPLSLLVEYNFTKSLAFGLKGQIRAYNTDYIERRMDKGVAKDYVDLLTLQLRYKFNANDKDHTRNINMAKFKGDKNYDTEIDGIINQIDGLGIDLEGLRNQLNNLDPKDPRYDELERRIEELEARPIPKELDEEAYVFFDFDKVDLDPEAYKAIEIAASKLQAEPTLQVEVRGFADNMGTIEYNEGLSQRRADVVKQVLIDTHGIAADRIIANGKGKLTDPPIAYRPNRRCDFYYFK